VSSAKNFITTRMVLGPLPFRPDISLYRPTPQSGLNAWLASEGHDDAPPYWAYAWGGGAVLALYLADHPEAVAGKSVLDFGAGSGLVGIASARAGASRILAIEPDPIARVALRLNAEANGVDIGIWTQDSLPKVDVVLAGDVFYTADVVAATLPLLTAAALSGARVLVGDPFRRDLPQDRLDPIAEYAVPDMGGPTPVRSGVFVLRA
jgi:predicted nicotinamide N-methyase